MEVVAISKANNALNSVVKTATTAITNEIGLIFGVQEELFFIKEELDMMQAFLEAASTERVKSVVVNRWIKQVQELAFDVEDCLHEASIHMMKKSCLPFMYSVKKRDDIARKIRVLRTRIDDVSQRNQRYNLINKDNSGYVYDERASSISMPNLLVGLDEPKRKLVNLITETNGEVISVVGMGGLGKTTLAREVYRCQELRAKFECFAWFTIRHPFIIEEFIEILARQILFSDQMVDNKEEEEDEVNRKKRNEANKKKKDEANEKKKDEANEKKTDEVNEKKLEVIDHLRKSKKKYLIVLDDLSSILEWDKIYKVLPHTVNGSRFIVTTRLRPLAESISKDDIYEINKLSKDDALKLFYKAVYKTPNYKLVINDKESKDDLLDKSKCNMKCDPHNTEIMEKESEVQKQNTEIIEEKSEVQKQFTPIPIDKDMQTQADLIIDSCGLLPLAIVTIGSYLATKPKSSIEWEAMRGHLSTELDNNPELGVLKNVLTSSYDGMPYHLKPNLLYLSVFHNHKEIRRSRIIRRWMADGYVMEGRKKTAEEVGKHYFNDFMGRNLIQPSQMSTIVNGDSNRCNIHDIMYELILAKAMDENTVSLVEDKHLITMTDKVRHLVITGESCKEVNILERVKWSHMRSVSIFGEVGNYLKYPEMKLVRVLDLEGTLNLNNRDLSNVGKLRYLKYLGLRGTKITELPNSLGKLRELETLDIRNTAVLRLPKGFAKLQKLSYLRAGFEIKNKPNFDFTRKHKELEYIADTCMMTVYKSDYSIDIPDGIPETGYDGYCCHLLCALCIWIPLLPYRFCLRNVDRGMDLKRHSYGMYAPRGIGELRSLTTLGMIDIGPCVSVAKELQKLTNLTKLAVTGLCHYNGRTLGEVICGLKNLRSLVLSADDDLQLKYCLHSVSSPPKYLQSLKLSSPSTYPQSLKFLHTHRGKLPDNWGKLPDWGKWPDLGKLPDWGKMPDWGKLPDWGKWPDLGKQPNLCKMPDWISSLAYLEKIHFKGTFLTEVIETIGQLPNLKILCLFHGSIKYRKELCFGKGTFPALQVMFLEQWFDSLSIKEKALKNLELLKISKSYIEHDGVSGLEFLVNLKEMEVEMYGNYGMSEKEQITKTLASNFQGKLSVLPNKPTIRLSK